MAAKFGITWILFCSIFCVVLLGKAHSNNDKREKCLKSKRILLVNPSVQFVKDTKERLTRGHHLQTNPKDFLKTGSIHLLHDSNQNNKNICVVLLVNGDEECENGLFYTSAACAANSGCNPCNVSCFNPKGICKNSKYNETYCNEMGSSKGHIINITETNHTCHKCKNPVSKPNEKHEIDYIPKDAEQKVGAAAAREIQKKMGNLPASLNESSALLSGGEGVHGAIVKDSDEFDEVYFAYTSPTDEFNIVSDGDYMSTFSRSIKVPKEAFNKAISANISVPFAAVLLFTNLAQDENKSTVLRNEVLMVDMGAKIANLSDNIAIDFKNISESGIPSCQSWNGEGSLPKWTDEGCKTVTMDNGTKISCQCSHLTFFAILMTPPNVTISTSDLNSLTTITKIGCSLSIFFLCIVLFMHFLLRKGSATDSTKLLIHLVVAMLLLNLMFLINSFVAALKSSVGCKIMAALMHYFLLATFTWFAVQGLHLCLQMYRKGNIVIHHYMLKVCITSWVTPSVIVVVLLALGKYGEQVIRTDNSANNVSMCWIIDETVHYIVNIGYYVIVFLLTFTTFTTMVSWLCYLKRTGDKQANRNGISIMTVMGLCCMLGITWGFAFFAYGDLRIPSYYIFTILNSLQGFFLFIYYYKRGHNVTNTSTPTDSTTNASRTTTIGTDVLDQNPYCNMTEGKN